MINITNKPPETLIINGTEYAVNTDFKTWIGVSETLKNYDGTGDDAVHNFKILADLIGMIFINPVCEPAGDILTAAIEFLRGYPKQIAPKSGNNQPVVSFVHDINYIIIAIRNQSGIDLSHRRTEPFHWWDFLLEFETLEEHHQISKIIGYRAYDGNDKDYLKLKRDYALPHENTYTQQKSINEINDIFYNS